MNIDALTLELKELTSAIDAGNPTPDQLARLDTIEGEIKQAQTERRAAAKGQELLGFLASGAKAANTSEGSVASLGDHVVHAMKSAGITSDTGRFGVTAGEYKAAGDTVTSGTLTNPQQSGRVAPNDFWAPTISALFAQAQMTGTSLTYFQERPVEGSAAVVAENGLKPQLSMGFDPITETLAKIAGVTKLSDELREDYPALASVVEGRLLRALAQAEETQIVSGAGTGGQLTGLLNRTGVQTETSAAVDANADALFRASMAVQTVTGLIADAIVINPADYQRLRLTKDTNGQYIAGGPFSGAYGQPGLGYQPPLWGLRTVVSAALPVGTALVGAFGVAGTVWRKGGVSVEIANQNEDDFRYNRIAIRAEERLGLEVTIPAAFNVVTLAQPI